VTTGRGGTGKTTFTALAAKHLPKPVLLIDIDPDQSLADMLGIDLEEQGVRTVLDVLYDIQKKQGYEELGTMPIPEKIEYLFNTECIYESDAFDLVSLGMKWTQGCYCAPNSLLRGIIPKLSQNYATTAIDAPAGLEHLNRNVTAEVDDLFLIMDPTLKSIKNIDRIKRLIEEIGVIYSNYFLVSNHRFNDELEKRIEPDGAKYLGRLDYDQLIEEYNIQGKSLHDLPDSSPAVLSVKRILESTGYGFT
jgi:CO dehydrogenase maturation factor